MANTYKQSFKQNYTDNVEISIYNCGLQSCEAGYTWGPGARDHYLIHLITAGKGTYILNGKVYELGLCITASILKKSRKHCWISIFPVGSKRKTRP